MTLHEKALDIVLKMEQDFKQITERLVKKTPKIFQNLSADVIAEGCENRSRHKIEEARRNNGQRVYYSQLANFISSTPYMKYTSERSRPLEYEIMDYVEIHGNGFDFKDLCNEVYDLYMKRFNENVDKIIKNE